MKNRAPENEIGSREEWVAIRKELLKKEKEFTRLRDQLSAERRELPWVKVEKNYVCEGPDGKGEKTSFRLSWPSCKSFGIGA